MTKPQADDLEAVRTIVAALEGFDEKDKERILRWAREKLGLAHSHPSVSATHLPPTALPATPTPVPLGAASDIKSFVEKKNPTSDIQFAATVAYYYRFEAPGHLRKESITKEDLVEACRQVGRDRLRHPAQTLVNAHTQGLLDRGERGAYAINTVGENLVAMALPSDGKGRSAPRAKTRGGAKHPVKKPTKRKVSPPKRKS